MNFIAKTDLEVRKKNMKKIAQSKKSWVWLHVVYGVLLALSVAIPMAVGVSLLLYSEEEMMNNVILMVGACAIACVPFIGSFAVRNHARYKCAYPYTAQANGQLIVDDEKLEYIYWNVTASEPAAYSSRNAAYSDEAKYIYSIKIKDIKSIDIHMDVICTIEGAGQLSRPWWVLEDDLNETDKIIPQKTFSFALNFSEPNVGEMLLQLAQKTA